MGGEQLFDKDALQSIEQAVREAEGRTSGEIVPMLVPSASAYTGVRLLAAALIALAIAPVVLASPLEPGLWLPPLQVVGFLVAYWIASRAVVLRRLVPTRHQADAVDRAAKLAFLEQGVIETRDRTGILIFISLLEHRVEVLADRAIHEAVAEGTWDGIVQQILEGIREGRASEGLVAAVRRCGEMLAADFPPRPDDTDELSNRLR